MECFFQFHGETILIRVSELHRDDKQGVLALQKKKKTPLDFVKIELSYVTMNVRGSFAHAI